MHQLVRYFFIFFLFVYHCRHYRPVFHSYFIYILSYKKIIFILFIIVIILICLVYFIPADSYSYALLCGTGGGPSGSGGGGTPGGGPNSNGPGGPQGNNLPITTDSDQDSLKQRKIDLIKYLEAREAQIRDKWATLAPNRNKDFVQHVVLKDLKEISLLKTNPTLPGAT